MPIPPQFQKGGDKGPPTDANKPQVSVAQALDVLEEQASTPRAHSAIKTLRDEFEQGGPPAKKPGSTTDAKQEALARMKG